MVVHCTIMIKSVGDTLFQTRPRIKKNKEEIAKQVLFCSQLLVNTNKQYWQKSFMFLRFGFGILVFKITDSLKLFHLSSKSGPNDKR